MARRKFLTYLFSSTKISSLRTHPHVIEKLLTCNDLYALKSKEEISPILNKYDTIKMNRYTIIKDKEIFVKKLKKHMFPFMITGIVNSITVNEKGELFFNKDRSLYEGFADGDLTLEDCEYVTNYIENQLKEYIMIDDVEIFFKSRDDIFKAYKELESFIEDMKKKEFARTYYTVLVNINSSRSFWGDKEYYG
jgi:hypothetical protein